MNYFLSSVGEAELLTKNNGKLQLFASARALTDAVINFSGTMEEVRGGKGAKLLGRFKTNSSVSIQLTNVMFNLKEVAAQIGAEIKRGANVKKPDQNAYIIDGKLYTTGEVHPLSKHCSLNELICWITSCSCGGEFETNAYQVKYVGGVETSNVVRNDNFCDENNLCGSQVRDAYEILTEGAQLPMDGKYKVSYYVPDDNVISSEINSVFNPPEFVLILKVKVFAGDNKLVQNGKNEVGTVTIKIPRYQLDGTLDLSLSMNQVASVGLSGTALVDSDSICSEGGEYAEIVEFIKAENDIKSIVFENQDEGILFSSLRINDYVPDIFGIRNNNEIIKIDIQDVDIVSNIAGLTFDENGKVLTKPNSYQSNSGYVRAILKDDNTIWATIEII